ncbi:hypothetical protein IRZ71_24765 [Flavobacterium sp. ANB]|uniref:hypothetical protein n=1 Tax=unclassified Flavobacterium TaxID=196869 RepID=UPI0012B7907D|nr:MULTISPECIES: hypothetical protein [unclassified Flavobacterium]MBF4519563.1 hypothetical protein [Flavobacterium sp. ANB]MTD72554.1 hypothetical protein [Flavobacterium sp. LC2016-13]
MGTMLKTIKHYDYEPVYFLTYIQNVCYSEILVNDIPMHNNFTELGDGETMEINNYIFKSGLQKVTFRLYPATKGKDFDHHTLTRQTDMKIEISESDNKKRDQPGKKIANYITQTVVNINAYEEKEFIATGKNYYEASFTFEAKVPYEFTSLDKGQDLRKWNQEKLEQKVVDFYKNQWRLINDKEIEEYFSFLELKEKETCQSVFNSRKELEENLSAYLEPFINSTFKLEPLENYQLKFYGDGKIVCLELTSTEAKMRGKSALWENIRKTAH